MTSSNQTLICHLKMTLNDGSVAEDTTQTKKPVQLVLGNSSLSPAFEKALTNPVVGDVRKFKLEPDEAFGLHDPNQVHSLPKSIFSVDESELKEGSIMMFEQNTGGEVPGVVNKIESDKVWVDFNHPLAGHVVAFHVEILEIKA
jgi:FKBP-type peptidyl-prolyl cis-trans isomerase SlpA